MIGRTRPRIPLALLIVAAAGGPGAAKAQAASPAPADAEVLAIYRVVIESLYVQPNTRQVLIRDSTLVNSPELMAGADDAARGTPDFPLEPLDELRVLSPSRHPHPAGISASVPVRSL